MDFEEEDFEEEEEERPYWSKEREPWLDLKEFPEGGRPSSKQTQVVEDWMDSMGFEMDEALEWLEDREWDFYDVLRDWYQ